MSRLWTNSVTALGGRARTGIRHRVQQYGPAIFVGFGGLLFLAANAYFLQYNSPTAYFGVIGLLNVMFYGVLSSLIILSGVSLSSRDIAPAQYPRAVSWLFAGLGFLLVLNGPIMVAVGGSMPAQFLYGWLLNVVATGSVAGAIVGVIEARSIERAKANQHLQTQQRATEAEAARLDYLNSILRHEVLNNVNVIKGYAELALDDPGDVTADLETIRDQTDEMAKVITDVRVLLESLQETESLNERNVSQTLAAELSKIQRKTDGVVEIDRRIPDDIHVMADDLLPRVFANLFANAVEHNDTATHQIAVTVDHTPDTVTVRVADNGPGIPASERETLFERGQRADHGLGLYLVHELVDRYGGRIELVETGSDGTEFSVTLHRAPDQPELGGPNQAPAAIS